MPVTPFSDRLEVINIISADEYIAALGFKPENILNTAYTDEKLENDTLQIFVYNKESVDGLTSLSIMPALQIDISVPLYKSSTAELAAEQIIALFNGKRLNGHAAMQLVAPSPANLPCQFGFECIGVRFRYDCTITNKIKKIQ